MPDWAPNRRDLKKIGEAEGVPRTASQIEGTRLKAQEALPIRDFGLRGRLWSRDTERAPLRSREFRGEG